MAQSQWNIALPKCLCKLSSKTKNFSVTYVNSILTLHFRSPWSNWPRWSLSLSQKFDMIKLIWKQYNWYVVLVIRFKKFAWKWPKLKTAKIESCQSWKLPKLKVAKIESCQNWKLTKLIIVNCQNWKLPNLKIDKVVS